MPTLGTHVDDRTAAIIETAAKASPQKKVGPWLAEAAHQRIEREGLDSEASMAKAELLIIADEVGPREVLDVVLEKFRRTAA